MKTSMAAKMASCTVYQFSSVRQTLQHKVLRHCRSAEEVDFQPRRNCPLEMEDEHNMTI